MQRQPRSTGGENNFVYKLDNHFMLQLFLFNTTYHLLFWGTATVLNFLSIYENIGKEKKRLKLWEIISLLENV